MNSAVGKDRRTDWLICAVLSCGMVTSCGQPVSFGSGAIGNVSDVAPAEQANLVPKSEVALPESKEPTPSSGAKSEPVLETSTRSREDEIADTPKPIAGGFLTDGSFLECWVNISPSVNDPFAGQPEITEIGCGLLTATGEKKSVNIPLDQWRIFSKSGAILDAPIPDLRAASDHSLWSVEFTLPSTEVARTIIGIKNTPKILPTSDDVVLYDLKKGLRVGGALNPNYFHLGGGDYSWVQKCGRGVEELLLRQTAVQEIFVPVTVTANDEKKARTGIYVRVLGVCGTNYPDYGFSAPEMRVYRRSDPSTPVHRQALTSSDNVVSFSLSPGEYDIAVKVSKNSRGESDNIGVRDFLVVPLSNRMDAGPIGVRGTVRSAKR